MAVPAGSIVLSHGSREGGGAAAANCCLLPEMPVLRGLAWGLFIARSRVAAGMAPCWGAGVATGKWCAGISSSVMGLSSAFCVLGAGRVQTVERMRLLPALCPAL